MKAPAAHRWFRRIMLCLTALAAIALFGRALPAHQELVNKSGCSQAVYDRAGRLLRLTLSADEKYRLWVPLEAMSPLLIDATLLAEDRHFYRHPGVNPYALLRAALDSYLFGSRRYGGSTITMQLARVRYNLETRTIRGKLLQILRALELEVRYSKKDILEAYLNTVSYGGNIEGAGAASIIYFRKEVHMLSLPEALSLTVIPQNPRARSLHGGSAPPAHSEAKARLFALWQERYPERAGVLSEATLTVSTDPLHSLPFEAPHFVQLVLRESAAERPSVIRSSLDLSAQRALERVVDRYLARRRQEGIENAAAILVHIPDMQVRAYLGSADFFSRDILGQVDGLQGLRSPGSALKPFIYALAMDQGLIHPRSLLKDAPLEISGYIPENSDGSFAGPLTAHDALIRSRNIPAIDLAQQLREPDLYSFLVQAGVRLSFSRNHYGLALALGGAELRPAKLVELYAALGAHGRLRPLSLWKATDARGVPLFTAEASALVVAILADNPRPDASLSGVTPHRGEKVSWKTGTSHGYRDAWAAGVSGPWALVVWVGNFDGRPNPVFTGKDAAGPLFFEILDALRVGGQLSDAGHLPYYLNLTRVEVCAVSGKLPNRHCPHRVAAPFIPGRSPIHRCDIHRSLRIDAATGLRACHRLQGETVHEVYELWSSDLQRLFARAGMPRRTPPPFHPTCTGDAGPRALPLLITSPAPKVHYLLRSNALAREQIPLQATADGEATRIHWFLDRRYLGSSAPGEPYFWEAQPGSYILRAQDDLGGAASRTLRVELAD